MKQESSYQELRKELRKQIEEFKLWKPLLKLGLKGFTLLALSKLIFWRKSKLSWCHMCETHRDPEPGCALCAAGFFHDSFKKYKPPFNPRQIFESIDHATAYCRAQADPDAALIAVIGHNYAAGERAFAFELLEKFYDE